MTPGIYKKYFIDDFFNTMFKKSKAYTYKLDEKGVITINYIERKLGEQYNPVAIATYALGEYNKYYDTRSATAKNLFLSHADWLVENAIPKKDFVVWHYNFDWISPGYRCKAPWISAMAQGLAMSVLIRAWTITGDEKYLSTAKLAFNSFKATVEDGGVARKDKKGYLWYDEYVCEKSANVLNGMMFAVISLHEYWEVTKDPEAKELFDEGVRTLEANLKRFRLELGFFRYSRYDDYLLIYSGEKYHKCHLQQLRYLIQVTDNKTFKKYLALWEKADRIKGKRLFLFMKLYRIYLRIIQRKVKKEWERRKNE